MTQTYRAAVIGCGSISRAHAHAYLGVPRVSLVAAADVREKALEEFGAEFGVERLYADAAELMAAEKPDLVSVCTPPGMHAALTQLACAGGAQAVICEKPMAMNLREADAMLAAARERGTILLVSHQRRFAARLVEARRLISDGVIGDVTQITGMCCFDAMSSGTHLVDAIRFLVDEKPIHSVFGAIDMSPYGLLVWPEFVERGTFEGHPVETSSMAILVFEDGMRAHLEIGGFARMGYVRLFVDGTAGRIEVGGEGWEGPLDAPPLRYRTDDGGWIEPELNDDFEWSRRSVERLLEVLEEGGEHPLDAESGRATLEVLMAIYESARRREIVRLPLALEEFPLGVMVDAGELPSNRPESMSRFVQLVDADAHSPEVDEVARALVAECPAIPGAQLAGFVAQFRHWGELPAAQGACLQRVLQLWEES